MSTYDEMIDHSDELADSILCAFIEGMIDQINTLIEMLQDRKTINLDVIAQLQRTAKLLTKYSDKTF